MEIEDLVRPAATIPQTSPFFTRVAVSQQSAWTISSAKVKSIRTSCCAGTKAGIGEIHTLDRALNQHALVDRAMVMSVYKVGDHTIWVITDAGWQTTTLLLPYER